MSTEFKPVECRSGEMSMTGFTGPEKSLGNRSGPN